MKNIIYILAMGLFIASGAYANEDSGLYDPAPPPGSTFVRFANDFNQKGSHEAKASGKRYDYVDYAEVTPYYVVPKGDAELSIGSAKASQKLEDGAFYTAILKDAGTVLVMSDKANTNMAKAQIVFYNLSNKENLTVKTNDGKIEVVAATPVNKSALRETNAVKVSLAVYDGNTKLKDINEKTLERGKTYNIFAFSETDIQWVPSRTNTSR